MEMTGKELMEFLRTRDGEFIVDVEFPKIDKTEGIKKEEGRDGTESI